MSEAKKALDLIEGYLRSNDGEDECCEWSNRDGTRSGGHFPGGDCELANAVQVLRKALPDDKPMSVGYLYFQAEDMLLWHVFRPGNATTLCGTRTGPGTLNPAPTGRICEECRAIDGTKALSAARILDECPSGTREAIVWLIAEVERLRVAVAAEKKEREHVIYEFESAERCPCHPCRDKRNEDLLLAACSCQEMRGTGCRCPVPKLEGE